MIQPTYAHYRMNECEIEKRPAATAGNCNAYLVEHGAQDVLCVMEGDAFHTFNISPQGLARLAEESTRQLRKHLVAGP